MAEVEKGCILCEKNEGNSNVTSVGMVGKFPGWAIPIGLHTLIVTLTGIRKKPGVVSDKIEIREYLPMTVSIDHDIVDGVPFTRFLSRLTELVENAFGLVEYRTVERVTHEQYVFLDHPSDIVQGLQKMDNTLTVNSAGRMREG